MFSKSLSLRKMISNQATLVVTASVYVCRGVPLQPVIGIPDSSISEPWYGSVAEAQAVCDVFNGKSPT
jgi:hypothetical protein